MNITPEVRAQLDEQKKQCIFCKIVSKEAESNIVYEDDLTLAALDIFPLRKGHTAFFPKEHYPIMPYIPANEFKHFFGILPQLAKSVQDAMVGTAVNIFMANGAAAGQMAPHFLVHILPREPDDGFFNFMWKGKVSLEQKQIEMLQHNFPLMMANHFKRNPAEWHKGAGEKFSIHGTVLYEDEKSIVTLPDKGVSAGHMEIYSKVGDDLAELSVEDSSHLFFVASFAATAVFEGLQAHGTNIIVKSGKTDDNSDGKLSIHVLPRMQGDGLKIWEQKQEQPKYDLKGIASRIKDETWKINQVLEKKDPVVKEEVIKMGSGPRKNEIQEAIEKMR
jgi:histidine triad (HIT) family protein